MKLGLILSAVLVIIVGAVAAFVIIGPAPDPPTRATAPEKLAAAPLPADLPPIFEPDEPDADAAALYEKAMDLYNDHPALAGKNPPTALARQTTDLLIRAMNAGNVTPGFLDAYLDVDHGAQPRFGEALEGVAIVGLDRAQQLVEQGDTAGAIAANCAVWALGQRAFEDNTLLYNRFTGLQLMQMAGQQLFTLTDHDSVDVDALMQWGEQLQSRSTLWSEKLGIVQSPSPKPADLVNIALHDGDRTFRIAAMLHLGVAKFNPGHRGNLRAIQSAIDTGRRDPDPLIAEAAGRADALTKDGLHRIR